MVLAKRRPRSNLQAWIYDENEIPTVLSFEDRAFYSFIHCLTTFYTPERMQQNSIPFNNLLERFRNHYDSDPNLFELGCYLLYLIDKWHIDNGLIEARREMLPFLKRRYVKMFNKFLGIDDADHLIDNRLNLYHSVDQNGGPLEELLCELLIKSAGYRQPTLITEMPLLTAPKAHNHRFLDRQVDVFKEEAVPVLLDDIETIYQGLGFLNQT